MSVMSAPVKIKPRVIWGLAKSATCRAGLPNGSSRRGKAENQIKPRRQFADAGIL